jgi:hypothetical protein
MMIVCWVSDSISSCVTGQYLTCFSIATLYGLLMVTGFGLCRLKLLYALCGQANTRAVLVDCCIDMGYLCSVGWTLCRMSFLLTLIWCLLCSASAGAPQTKTCFRLCMKSLFVPSAMCDGCCVFAGRALKALPKLLFPNSLVSTVGISCELVFPDFP